MRWQDAPLKPSTSAPAWQSAPLAGDHVHPSDIVAPGDQMTTDENGHIVPVNAMAQGAIPVDQPQPMPDSSALMDTAAQGISGLHEGVAATLSLPSALARSALSVGPTVANSLFGTKFSTNTDYIPDPGRDYLALGKETGFVKPPDEANRGVRKVAQYLGGSILPGSIAAMSGAPIGMLAREAASSFTAGLGAAGANEILPGNPWAELAGSILGGAAPAVIEGTVRKLVTPFPNTPEREAMVKTLGSEGIGVTAGQRTGSKALQYAESELGGGSARSLMETQSKQFTRAALKKVGINADAATPDVMTRALDDIGNEFDDLAAKTSVPLDSQLQNDMLGIVDDYQSTAGQPAKVVENMMNRAGDIAAQNGGVITGEGYRTLRSTIGRLSKSTDPATQQALRAMQGALDDAVERYMPTQFVEDWRAVRGQYRNMLVIERAAGSAGPTAAMGVISPAQLASAAKAIEGKRNWIKGSGNMDELARSGVATMTPLPDSGTSSRLRAGAVASVPATIGGFLGSPAGFLGVVGGAAAGAATPFLMGKALLAGRGYLGNQLWRPVTSPNPGVTLTSQSANAMRGFSNTMTLDQWAKQQGAN